jgi:secreted PhoX family phosphatase
MMSRAIGSSLRSRAVRDGAARFARGEGMWATPDAIYWACTEGGRRTRDGGAYGQLWKYTPSPHEGTDRERESPGQLELILEPNNSTIMDHPDNITASPWGDLIVCEDGEDAQYLLGVTASGEVYRLAKNAHNGSEFAGAAFSPDGTTLFVNIQNPGYTLAITGNWKRA